MAIIRIFIIFAISVVLFINVVCLKMSSIEDKKNVTNKACKKMTNREYLSSLSNKELGVLFCDKIAQSGGYCRKCPFYDWCKDGDCGFEKWLGDKRRTI